MAPTDLAAESRQVAADHSFLLPTVSSCEAAAATYGSIPVFILPIYFIPIGIVMLLLLYTLVLIGKGVSGRITTTGSRIAEAMFMYGSWPRGMDDGELAADAMAERELVCTAIELLDSDHQRVPDVFRCPIGLNIMRDPVMTSDGHTYEREQAKEFLSKCGPSSPLTKQRMAASCVANIALARCMESWLSAATEVEITTPTLEALIRRLRERTELPPPVCLPSPRVEEFSAHSSPRPARSQLSMV